MENTELGLTPAPTLPPVIPVPPAQPKSPGTAFLLSLLVPGLGQMYAGAMRRGGWTFFFSALCLVLLLVAVALDVSGEALDLLVGIALRTGLALYVFAFLDAYFTTREFNDGTLAVKPYNARLATVLNLTTRGFGYWHLDERKRGIAFFVLVGLLDRAARKVPGDAGIWAGIALELLLAGLAIDAYRMAVRKNQEVLARIPPGAMPLQPESGLNPRIPLALAGLLAVCYVGIIAVGVLLPDYEKIDQAAATISDAADGKQYRNPKYGVELRVPAGWAVTNSDADYIVETEAVEGGCSLSLSADGLLPFQGGESFADDVIEQVPIQVPHLEFRQRKPARLGHVSAHEVLFVSNSQESGLSLRYVMAKSGLTIFYMIIASTPDAEESCAADVAKIRESVVLPK